MKKMNLIKNFFNCMTCFIKKDDKLAKIDALNNALEFKSKQYRNALIDTITSVSNALEIRDPYTAGHQQRVSEIAVKIGKKLNFSIDRLEGLRLGASIHDIGKLAIPTELLVKPSRFNDIEYSLVKTHAKRGDEIFTNVHFPWCIKEIIMQHHERLDGTGYPSGLIGDEICLEARIVAVADVFDAISSHRPYRAALGVEYAIDELLHNKDRFYDAEVVDVLIELVQNKEIIY